MHATSGAFLIAYARTRSVNVFMKTSEFFLNSHLNLEFFSRLPHLKLSCRV